MTQAPSGSGKRVLPAAGGREEGGESAGPAPPPSGMHVGGSGGGGGCGGGSGTGGPGAGLRERVGGVARRPSWRELENHPCRPEPVTQERASSAIPTRGASRPRISASLPVRAPCFSHTLACRLPAPHFTRRFTSKHPRPDRPRGGGSPEVWRSAAPAPLGRQLSPRGPRPQLASFSYNALQSVQMFTGNTVDGRTN
nr:uncharacterized protein LOC115851094 [Globicephala melas]